MANIRRQQSHTMVFASSSTKEVRSFKIHSIYTSQRLLRLSPGLRQGRRHRHRRRFLLPRLRKVTAGELFLFREQNNGTFTANAFGTCISGRWLTMDAGDVDDDGDIDLALGN